MKVIHICINERYGAGRAAYRLHHALMKSGIDSKMIVEDSLIREPSIINIGNNKKYRIKSEFYRLLEFFPFIRYRNKKDTLFSNSVFGQNLKRYINQYEPDLIHLHWINRSFGKISLLHQLKLPVVFSLHDMWAFTGGCHYSQGCLKYTKQCVCCPELGSKHKRDLSTKNQKRKSKTYSKSRKLVFIGLSSWITRSARQSLLLKDYEVFNLPNTINTDYFRPFEQQSCRRLLNLNSKARIILFGALSATSDKRKGYDLLSRALENLNRNDKITFVVLGGEKKPDEITDNSYKHYLGTYNDELSLVLAYNAADLVVVPSVEENLSNVIMESLSCGTPVVAFNIGGNSDMIKHKNNGYLAKNTNPIDLAQGIGWVLDELKRSDNIRKNARLSIENNFSETVVANQYISLYKSILKETKS